MSSNLYFKNTFGFVNSHIGDFTHPNIYIFFESFIFSLIKDISIVSLFQIGSMIEGVEINNISDAFENQILIGLENDNYYWIKEKQILGIKPTEENNIFE